MKVFFAIGTGLILVGAACIVLSFRRPQETPTFSKIDRFVRAEALARTWRAEVYGPPVRGLHLEGRSRIGRLLEHVGIGYGAGGVDIDRDDYLLRVGEIGYKMSAGHIGEEMLFISIDCVGHDMVAEDIRAKFTEKFPTLDVQLIQF